jgi:hypothetical protein
MNASKKMMGEDTVFCKLSICNFSLTVKTGVSVYAKPKVKVISEYPRPRMN